jgi:hypothetical protein
MQQPTKLMVFFSCSFIPYFHSCAAQNVRVPRPAPGQRTDPKADVPHIARVSAGASQKGHTVEALSKVFNAAQQQGMRNITFQFVCID